MIKYQAKRIIGNATNTVTADFPTLSTMQRVVGIFCSNENTQDCGEVQLGLDIGGVEIFPEDFPLRLLTDKGKRTPSYRHVEKRLKRFFDLTPFAIRAGGETVEIALTGNRNHAVDVVLVLDQTPVTHEQIRKYQIVRVEHQANGTAKKSFATFSDYSKVTGISLISDQLVNGFCYNSFSRFGLKIGGAEIFPIDYPANHLLVNPQCVQMDENFYDLKPFDVQAGGTTAEVTYLHDVSGVCQTPELICVFELTK